MIVCNRELIVLELYWRLPSQFEYRRLHVGSQTQGNTEWSSNISVDKRCSEKDVSMFAKEESKQRNWSNKVSVEFVEGEDALPRFPK
jgi:hypothetical protein